MENKHEEGARAELEPGEKQNQDTAVAIELLRKEIEEGKQREAQFKEHIGRLEQVNQELKEFSNFASHDLREPLRKIITFGDLLKEEYDDSLGVEGKEYLEYIRGAARRMQHLLGNLQLFSRIIKESKPFVSVDLEDTVTVVLSDLELRLQETGGKVESNNLPTIKSDPSQMRQLLQNLISNALKFHKPGIPPLVKIGCSTLPGDKDSSQGYFQIQVEDNGIGFEKKHTERIFNVFQRLHNRSQYEGSGVGLAICKKIIEHHGGNITAKSVLGEGSTFIFTIPTSAVAPTNQPKPIGNKLS